jgi:serine phosphatase RsbU (regulator of sigma subunit)
MTDARLQVTDSQGRRVVTLDKPVFIIGRRTAADLQLVNADISREHAEIERVGAQYLLRDRGSRYGTYVNGEQITEKPLEHGDRIRLGRTEGIELVFMTEASTHASGLREAASDAGDLRQMAAILNGLRALGTGRVLEEVLTLVLDSALDVTKAERGFIMLARPDGELEFKVARGRGGVTLPGTSFTTSSKIPREVFLTGQSRIVGDLMDGNLAGMHDGTIAIGIRHVLCVPLSVNPMGASEARGRHIIGVLYLDGRERSTMLSQATRSSLEAFATQAALAIDSARLYAESAEKARIERDLRIAAEIQRALLPEPTYQTPHAALAASSIPCRTVGGDFFDYIEIGENNVGFALGDVAGKGPPAALLAAAVQSNFAAQAPVTSDPADTMTRVNRALLRRAIEARFATMFYGVVTPEGRLSYCNAGQEPPLVIRRDGIAWLEAGGPVLGLLTMATYEYDTVTLESGDLVVVCSDGVTEARNLAGEEFGRDRLVATLEKAHGARPEVALGALLDAVKKYSEGAAQGDDITALVLRFGAAVGGREAA